MNDLALITSLVEQARPRFLEIEPNANFAKEAAFAVQVLSKNDYTIGIARNAQQSVIDAVTNIAAVGLSLNPAQKQAYLIPRDGKICLDISYIGLLDLAIMSGAVKWGAAELVHAADKFSLVGVDEKPIHERDPFASIEVRGDIIGAYVTVKTRDDAYLTTTMALDEILYVRDRSEAWKQGVAKNKPMDRRGPWGTDFGEMAKKTVIKRAYKLWPKVERLDRAIHLLNTEGGEGLPAIENHSPYSNESEPETRTRRTLSRLDRAINQGGVGRERAQILRMVAGACIQKFNEGNAIDAYGEACTITDPEEQEILWAILAPHPTLRSAIKRMAREEADAQRKLDEAERLLKEAIDSGHADLDDGLAHASASTGPSPEAHP